MIRGTTIDLHPAWETTQAHAPYEALTCLPGRVIVQKDSWVSPIGLLPPPSGSCTPDIGTVVASGVEDLPVGTRVICAPDRGGILRPVETGRETNLHIYGVCEDVENAILAKIGTDVHPYRRWCLVNPDTRKSELIEVAEPKPLRQGFVHGWGTSLPVDPLVNFAIFAPVNHDWPEYELGLYAGYLGGLIFTHDPILVIRDAE